MNNYKCLVNNEFAEGAFRLVPVRKEDIELIRIWRNEQIYHLRQAKPLTEQDQERYFHETISKLFEVEKPNQIIFSYLQNGVCIGYGGLVHINWIDKNAEISFIINTELEKDYFTSHWINYLSLIEKVAFEELKFHKIFTYAFDLRPKLYEALEHSGFEKEATFKEHCFFENQFIDMIIHSKINQQLYPRKAKIDDIDLFFEWANDPTTRQNSFDTKPIDYQTHTEWFKGKIVDGNCLILVFENDIQQTVGQVRIEKKETENVIGVSIDKNFRGKGLASLMIEMACSEFFDTFSNENTVSAYIKNKNIASQKSFKTAGFECFSKENSGAMFQKKRKI